MVKANEAHPIQLRKHFLDLSSHKLIIVKLHLHLVASSCTSVDLRASFQPDSQKSVLEPVEGLILRSHSTRDNFSVEGLLDELEETGVNS